MVHARAAHSLRLPLFVFVLGVAAVVRFVGLFSHSTIPDEAFTFFVAAHQLPGIISILKTGDFHPPLSYVLGHALFSLTSRAYLFRIVSALFGIAGVAATYAVARRALGAWGWVAALLVAVSPVLGFWDGFFRMYAMLWSLAMVGWACLLWAMDEPRRAVRWVAYALVATALLYTQYLSFFTIAGQVLFVAVTRPKTSGFWLACLAALALFSPWLPVFFSQYALGGTALNSLAGHLWQLLKEPAVLLVDGVPLSLELAPLLSALLWLVLGVGVALAIVQQRWLLLALCIPIVMQVAYSLVSGKLLLGQRYLLQAIPPMALLIVAACQWLWSTRLKSLSVAALTALTALMLAGTADKHFLSTYMPVDWTVYGKFLDARVAPGDVVVFDGSMVYYTLVGTKAVSDRPIYLITNPAEAERYGAKAAAASRVWYVGYQTDLPDPNFIAFKAIRSTHPRAITWRSTSAAYGDVVVTTLFLPAEAKRGP